MVDYLYNNLTVYDVWPQTLLTALDVCLILLFVMQYDAWLVHMSAFITLSSVFQLDFIAIQSTLFYSTITCYATFFKALSVSAPTTVVRAQLSDNTLWSKCTLHISVFKLYILCTLHKVLVFKLYNFFCTLRRFEVSASYILLATSHYSMRTDSGRWRRSVAGTALIIMMC